MRKKRGLKRGLDKREREGEEEGRKEGWRMRDEAKTERRRLIEER